MLVVTSPLFIVFDIWATFVIVARFCLLEIILLLASPKLFLVFLVSYWTCLLSFLCWQYLLCSTLVLDRSVSLYTFSLLKLLQSHGFSTSCMLMNSKPLFLPLLFPTFWSKYIYIQLHTFYFHMSSSRRFKLTVKSLLTSSPQNTKQKCGC